MFPSISMRTAALVLVAALGVGGVAGSEEERVMTLSDLGMEDEPSVPPAITVAPTPTDPAPIAVQVDPLIYNEDGSLYTGPMPDGTFCVNGRITAAPVAAAPASVMPRAYDAEYAPGAAIIERPWFFFEYGFIDPDIERYWGDHVWLPGYNRWDLYRYRPERRPPPGMRREGPRRSR